MISHLIVSASAQEARRVSDLLSPSEMYSGQNRALLEACYGVANDGQPVDTVTIVSWLRDRGKFEQVGYPYLTEVIGAVPFVGPDRVGAYAATVRRCAQRRQLLKTIQLAEAEIYAGVGDHDAWVQKFAKDVVDQATASARAKKGFVQIKDPMIRMAKRMQAHAKGHTAGIPTGIESLDRLTGGLHDSDLTIVAARPGMGKTSFVVNVIDNISSRTDAEGRPQAGLIFELEMPDEQLAQRLVASRSGVDVAALRNGRVGNRTEDVFRAANEVSKLPIYVDDTSNLTIEDVCSRARGKALDIQREGMRLAVVVVDYLQIMNLNERRNETETAALGRITKGLKSLAKELSCPVVCLSQLNRDLEKRQDKRPQMNDLRSSGAIEQDADVILFLFREDYYAKTNTGIAEIIVAKQRNGQTGTAEALWDGATTTFRSGQPREQDEEFYSHVG